MDSGGKIRTVQILRGMKGGQFEITLVSPGESQLVERHRSELSSICDQHLWWPQSAGASRLLRLRHLIDRLPVSVRSDWSGKAAKLVASLLDQHDVVVFDFIHSVVLSPAELHKASVL